MIKLIVIGLITLTTFTFIGRVINHFLLSSLTSQGKIRRIFYDSFVGLITIVILFSIYLTSGKTVFIILIIPLVYLIFIKRNNFKEIRNISLSTYNYITYILLFIPIFLIQYLLFLKGGVVLDTDKIFYSEISFYLIENGVESIYNNMSSLYPSVTELNTPYPYHYFELVLNAFIIYLFEINASYSLVIITFPILATIFWFGILNLISRIVTVSNQMVLFSLLFLFFSPIFLKFYSVFFDNGNFYLGTTIFSLPSQTFNLSVINYFAQKHIVTYVFVIVLIELILDKKESVIVMYLIIFPILNIAFLPSIIFSLLVFYFIKLCKRECKSFLVPIIFQLIALISYLVFYKESLIVSNGENLSSPYLYIFFKELNIKGEFMRFILKILIPILWQFILYLPLIFLINFNKLRSKIIQLKLDLIIIPIVICLGGLLTLPFMQGLDGGQFFTYTLPILNLIVFICVFYSVFQNNIKRLKKVVLFTVLIFNCFSISERALNKKRLITEFHDENYINSLDKELLSKSNVRFGYLLNENQEKNIEPANWYTIKPGEYIRNKYNIYDFYSLNNPNIKYGNIITNSVLLSNNNQLKYYIKTRKLRNLELIDIQLRFIEEMNINYLIVNKDTTIPHEMKIIFKLLAIDSISGERIYKRG